MSAGKSNGIRVLIGLSAALVLVALVLSLISSGKAYAFSNLTPLVAGAVVALVLDALVVLLGSRLPELLRDVLLLIAVFATSLALCTVLRERATLAGYVWFSDLESNNPVAVSAMNLAVAAICAFLGALVCTIVAGFRKVRKA